MFRVTTLLLAAAVSAVSAAAAFASDEAYTTRIEPRGFYGATISIEEGVRVFRPLPPVRHVIVNPGNQPLNLSFQDTRIQENRTSTNYNYNYNEGGGYVGYGGYGGYGVGGGFYGGHGGKGYYGKRGGFVGGVGVPGGRGGRGGHH